MQARGKPIFKINIIKLLEDYKQNSGYLRSWLGDTAGATDVAKMLEENLKDVPNDQALDDEQCQLLLEVLKNRFERLRKHWVRSDYRTDRNKNTNILFTKLAEYLAEYFQNTKILALVQNFENDYIKGRVLLFNCPEKIFVTSQNYAIPLSQVLDCLSKYKMYSIYDAEGDNVASCVFSERDIENLKKIPEAKAIIEKPKTPNTSNTTQPRP